jgi:hypothetical protein
MSFYTIQCIGFDSRQQDAISAILNLAESVLTDKWSIRDSADADAMMINLDAANSGQLCAEQRQRRKPYRIILVADNERAASPDNWFLVKKHNAPPSLREISQLLNQVSICLEEEATLEVEEPQALINNKTLKHFFAAFFKK